VAGGVRGGSVRRLRSCGWWCPEGNGKTTLLAAIALYHGDYTPSAFVPIGASS
jgi:hypothetical protein